MTFIKMTSVTTCGHTPSFILFLKFSSSPSSKNQTKVYVTVETQNKAGLLGLKHFQSCLPTVVLNWVSIIWPIKLPKCQIIGRQLFGKNSLIHLLVSQIFVVSMFKESDEGLCDSQTPKQGRFVRFETLLKLPAHSEKLGIN